MTPVNRNGGEFLSAVRTEWLGSVVFANLDIQSFFCERSQRKIPQEQLDNSIHARCPPSAFGTN